MALTKITSDGITDGTITSADINASAAIAGTKISPDFGSQNIVTTGSIGIGIGSQTPSTPQKQLHIAHDSSPRIMLSNDTTGHATPNGTELLLDSNGNFEILQRENLNLEFFTNGSQRMTINGSGNVGIGTISPTAALSVKGADTSTGSGGTAALELRQGDANNEFVNLAFQTGSAGPLAVISAIADATGVYPNTTGQLTFNTQVGSGVFERMRIDSSGKVHIGLTNGTGQFNVKNSNDASTNALEIYNDNGVRNAAFSQSPSGDATLDLRTNAASQTVLLRSNGVSHFSGGNVGIGTTSPSNMLHLSGTDPIIQFTDTVGGDSFGLFASHTNYLGFYNFTDSRVDMAIDGSGNVGIGTTSPSSTLDVNGIVEINNPSISTDAKLIVKGNDTNNHDIITAYANTQTRGSFAIRTGTGVNPSFLVGTRGGSETLGLMTNGSERMRIDSSGNVGINQVPTRELSVHSPNNNNALIHFTNDDTGETSADGILVGLDGNENMLIANQETGKTIRVLNGGSERMRIASNGKVGIGIDNPVGRLHLYEATNDPYIYIQRGSGDTTATLGGIFWKNSTNSLGLIDVQSSDINDGKMRFYTMGSGTLSERMRISSDGVTDFISTSHVINATTSQAAGGSSHYCYRGHHSSGTISFNVWSNGDVQNTNNSYSSISDVKLKENIVDANSQWSDIKALKIRNYNFKPETKHETHTQIGVVAQELETVCPKLVTEIPDIDSDGKDLGTTTKSVNYSVLYMKSIKALQEAIAKIETLETKVAALEAK